MLKKYFPKVIYRDQFEQIIFTFKQVFSLLWKSNPKFTILIFAISALWGLLTFPTFYLEKLILDKLVANLGNIDLQTVIYPISYLIIARIIVEILKNTLTGILAFMRNYASKNFHIRVELILADKLSRLDVATLEDPVFQDKFNKIDREAGRRAWGLMMPLTDIPNYVFGFISSIGILWFLHPLIALGVVLMSIPWILADRKIIKRWYDFELEIAPYHRIRGHIAHYLIRTNNYLELRILNLRDYLIKRMDEVHGEIISREMSIEKYQEKAQVLTYIPSAIFYAGVNIYLVFQTLGQKITIGSYELFLRSLLSASQNFSSLTNSFMQLYENYIFISDLTWFLGLESKIKEEGGKSLKSINDQLEIKDLWFRYKDDGAWILKGINTNFKSGEKIAIVGENGAGKSTLIKILSRFYDPTKGQVLVDGEDVRKVHYSSYQQIFAILFQNFEDYSFTARESIGFGDIDRVNNLPKIKEAAKKTDIHDYIESLPLKYETPLAPHFFKGVQLSGGQWQRIGIARMLFRERAQILILDEPTSNVDPEAEEKIFNELYKISKDKILIFVSQRFSTVRRADKILVVDQGKIIEQGTHEELMKKKGKYARLFSLQAKGYK